MKVLVGYVRSPEGRAALDAAVLEARLRDAELVMGSNAQDILLGADCPVLAVKGGLTGAGTDGLTVRRP